MREICCVGDAASRIVQPSARAADPMIGRAGPHDQEDNDKEENGEV
jgi:hypothetical protein